MKQELAVESNPAPEYTPTVVSEVGTVTEVTLGSNKKEGQDDTEYWH
ncbi:hypothetical protein OG949_41350 (plasmid) [Streptomyces scopuliridis]|nr:hypothetical protein [Streptomyces scopuliridis]WSB39189.1 hypothetical protein OG949_41350 [Streptomyces scopuliridis]